MAGSGQRAEEDGPDHGLADREADPLTGLEHTAGRAAHRRGSTSIRDRVWFGVITAPWPQPITNSGIARAAAACSAGRWARQDGQRDRADPERRRAADHQRATDRVTTRPASGAATALPTAYAVTPRADWSAV